MYIKWKHEYVKLIEKGTSINGRENVPQSSSTSLTLGRHGKNSSIPLVMSTWLKKVSTVDPELSWWSEASTTFGRFRTTLLEGCTHASLGLSATRIGRKVAIIVLYCEQV